MSARHRDAWRILGSQAAQVQKRIREQIFRGICIVSVFELLTQELLSKFQIPRNLVNIGHNDLSPKIVRFHNYQA